MKLITKQIVTILLILIVAINLSAEDMLLNWKFDSPYEFGAFEYDSSGNNNDGVVLWDRIGSYGGVSWKPDSGFVGGAGFLPNGVRGSMSTKNELSLPDEWSMSVLIKPLVTKNRYDGMITFKTPGKDGKVLFNLSQSNTFRASFDNEGVMATTQSSKHTMSADKWNHLVLVYQNDKITFHVNGKSDTKEHTLAWNPETKFKIIFSGRNGAPHHRLYGMFDEFRIYGRALGEDEVNQLGTEDFYRAEKVIPVVDSGMGYTAWLNRGKAAFKMQGGQKFNGHNVGDVKYEWSVLHQPKGAKGKFANPADPKTTFTTNKAGDYKFKLTASNETGKDEKLVNGIVFVKDKGPAKPKLYTLPPDRIVGEMIAPSPARSAALKGKSIAPIAYWSFDEAGNKVASGTGPKAKEVKLPDAVTFTDKGKVGGALHLVPEKGKNAVLDFGAFPELSNEFTISFWAISERDSLKAAFFYAKGDNDKEYWRLSNSHNSCKIPHYSNLFFDGQKIHSPIRIEGHWTHFVIAYSETGEYKKLYVDGWLAGSGPNLPLNKDATGIPQLIFNNTGDNYSFEGMIDEVAVYDKILNCDEVYKIYTGGVKSLEKRVPVDPYTTLAYTQDFIKKYFPEPKTTYQTKNFAEDRFEGGNLPPYTHPRLNMTMEDMPRIRQSFLKSQQGNNNNSFMYHYSRTIFGQNLERYTPNTQWKKDIKDPMSDPQKNYSSDHGNGSCARMSLAYEALMRADSKLARILIENMVMSADVQQVVIDQGLKKGINGWQGWYHDILGRRCTQIMYDYLYNWMTEPEKKQIRKVIAGATAGNWSIGMYAMPALYANRSNWQAWLTGDMMIALQSIYGEDGFCQFTYDEAARAVNACAEIMNDPESGAHYEGMGKSSINATQLSVLSRMQPKGKKVISSKAIYNNVAKFHLHIGLPWTNKKVMYDQKNGGNAGLPYASINALHYAYPDDPVLNYLKHCIDDGASSYTSMRPRTFGQESWMISAVYNQDWTGPKDLQKHLKYAAEKAGEPLGYFSDFRGQMVSRSSWEPDALQLNYVARVIKGGHHAPVKGYFVVNGLERQWIEFRSRANHHTRMNSCVTVDGEGQDGTVARSLAYSGASKTKGALFDILSSELTGGYRQINNKWPNLNYTRLKPDPRPWFDMPKQYLTHWYLGDRPYAPVFKDYDKFDPENYKGKKEFAYAYRSAAFARGTHPYILIVDDFKKDDKEREYIWHAALPDDLKQNLSVHLIKGDVTILTDPNDPEKHLMVKMFGYEGKGEFVIEHVLPTQDVDRAKMNLTTEQMPHNLKFKNRTSTAKFRALIYAYRDGDPLPKVTGKDGKFTITIGDQVDTLTLSTSPKNSLKVQLKRK